MEVKQHLQELLDKGVIAPSQSSSASPIVLVRKKNGAMRMCVDYVGKFFYNLAEFVFEFFCDSRRILATFACKSFVSIRFSQHDRTVTQIPNTSSSARSRSPPSPTQVFDEKRFYKIFPLLPIVIAKSR